MFEDLSDNLNSLSERLDKIEAEISRLTGKGTKRTLNDDAPSAKRARNALVSIPIRRQPGDAETVASLFRAAEHGDVQTIFRMLTDYVDVEERNEEGDSALHVAANAGHEGVVTVLLGNIPVDIIGHRGRTALHYASTCGHVSVVRRLLNAGANADATDCAGNFALLLAVKGGHVDVVKLLKKHNASLDLVDSDGNSSIVAAAKSKHWQIVEFLVESGASPGEYKEIDNAPLYLVAKEKNYPLVKNMIKKIEDKEEQMHFALLKCFDVTLVHMFEDSVPGFCRTQDGRDVLPFLGARGRVDVLGAMLDRGADVDGFDSLHGASCLIRAALHGRVNVMKLLLERGASVDLRDSREGATALHSAAKNGYVECVRLLLGAKASVNIKDNQSKTPFDVAKTDEIRQLLKTPSSQS